MRAPTKSLGIVSLFVAGVLALTGCSAIGDLLGGNNATRDEESQEITESGNLDVFTLAVGDCFDETDSEEIYEVPVVPCDQPHDNEVFFEYTLQDGSFPGDQVISDGSLEQCDPAFASFVGLTYDESALDWYPITPTQGSWDELDDRLVQCVIYDPNGKVTGSLAGAAR